MKKKLGFTSTAILVVIGIVGFAGFITWGIVRNQTMSPASKYDINNIIDASEETGWIAEHIEGNPDAKLKFIEYSDYQCSGCASVVDDVEKLLEKYDGNIAIIHRTYVLSYHTNGVAAATAAEAAGLQGYWKKYGDYLFEKQEDWFYSDANKRVEQFVAYFDVVTEGKGDIEKFKADMDGEKAKAKVNFDISLAKTVSDKIEYTPAFFLDGEFVNWAYDKQEGGEFVDYFSKIIDEKVKD